MPARARVEGEELVIALSDGPEIRLKKDLSGFWRWGAKTSERPVQFEVTDEGKLKGRTVGPFRREDWILER